MAPGEPAELLAADVVVTPGPDGLIDGAVFSAPHCDERVLHAPRVCRYCDAFPQRQTDREVQGINFTGEWDLDKVLCPSEARRDVEVIHRWPGNQPKPPLGT